MQKLLHWRALNYCALSCALYVAAATTQKALVFVFVQKCRKKLDLDYFLCNEQPKPMSTRERERARQCAKSSSWMSLSRPSRCSAAHSVGAASLALALALCVCVCTCEYVCMVGRHNLHCCLLLFLLLLAVAFASSCACMGLACIFVLSILSFCMCARAVQSVGIENWLKLFNGVFRTVNIKMH